MDMFEEARALAVTMKMRKMNQNETAKSLGVSPSYISNKLRLLGLSEIMQKQITENNLTERHARALLRLENEENRQIVLDRVCKEGLSVQRTEGLVDLFHVAQAPTSPSCRDKAEATDAFFDSLKESLCFLRSTGISVEEQVCYDKNKTYISICIKD